MKYNKIHLNILKKKLWYLNDIGQMEIQTFILTEEQNGTNQGRKTLYKNNEMKMKLLIKSTLR